MKSEAVGLLASALFGGCLAWNHATEQDFRRAIAEHPRALVAFIHPSSLASQALESEWIAIDKSHEETSLLSIDCSTDTTATVCAEFDVVSYPAIRLFESNGQNVESYRGARKASAITSFLKRAAHTSIITTLTSAKEIATFQSSDDDAVLIARVADEHVMTTLETIATRYWDRMSFGLVEEDNEGTAKSVVECYNNKDGQKFTLSDFAAVDALPKLVESCLAPLIGEFTRANEMKYLQSGKSLVFYFAKTSIEREAYVKEMRPVAKIYKEYLSFVTVDAEEYGDMTLALGLAQDVFPALAVQNPMYGQAFPFASGSGALISPETVGAFVMDIVQGKVKPWDGQSRTAEVPAHDEL